MARQTTQYSCQQCGAVQPKWSGQCPACEEWNCLVEEKAPDQIPKGMTGTKGKGLELVPLTGSNQISSRHKTNISEFDRVTGGGLVPGSAILIGGDPGIGKSTILLQICAALSQSIDCLYISGEEAIDQVRLRAKRLSLDQAQIQLATATNVRDILGTLDSPQAPSLVVIDSIQTMYVDSLESAPGTVSQVRASAQELIRVAKRRGIILLIVGHVTKDGQIAGPRVLEHMVDTVLYFEGERGHHFRILRSVKNRFGATDEIGVFEMTELGLQEVTNPSALFLAERQDDVSGSCVFAGIEGSRPVLVEIQALVAPTPLATPRRAVIGWDSSRLAMILAVLETRCGIQFSGKEVYLNVAGGLRVTEPAADLAVAAALLSSLTNTPLPSETVVFGEVGLAGEIRPVSQAEARVKEAQKLGFEQSWMPKKPNKGKQQPTKIQSIIIKEMRYLQDLLQFFEKAPVVSIERATMP